MIKNYFRPKILDQALELLSRADVQTIPLAGGTAVYLEEKEVDVVDIQDLGLNKITQTGDLISIGAAANLESLKDYFADNQFFYTAINIQAARNLREQTSLAGLVVSEKGRSPLLTLLLGLDLDMVWQPGNVKIKVGDWLPQRKFWNNGKLITHFEIDTRFTFRFETIARSPLDLPIICICITKWASGRMRIVCGGFGETPAVILDGNEKDDYSIAIKNTLAHSTDQWATSDYRIAAANTLCERMLNEFSGLESNGR